MAQKRRTRRTGRREKIASRKPAEKATFFGGALALAIANLTGFTDPEQLTVIAGIVAAIPYLITELVDLISDDPADEPALSAHEFAAPFTLPIVEELEDTVRDALRKARKGEDWNGDLEAVSAVVKALDGLAPAASQPAPKVRRRARTGG